jgi:hypothetical protein
MVIGILFAGLVTIELMLSNSFLDIVFVLGFDGTLLLGIGVTYLLQLTDLRGWFIWIPIAVFGLFNFLPAFGEERISWLFVQVWGGVNGFTSIVRGIEIAFLMLLIVIVKQRRNTPTVKNMFSTMEVYMAPKYQVDRSNVGAIGDNARAENFSQASAHKTPNVDLAELAKELTNLRVQIAKVAEQPDQFASLGDVAAAEIAAKAGDGPLALEKLKSAGVWFWQTAEKIGVGVATAAVKQALGF